MGQIEKLKARFGLNCIVLVGDCGMITTARIRADLQPNGLDWISSLRAPQIQALANAEQLQLSLFDTRDLAEISAPNYPGERLIVCNNPLLAGERARKREDLLQATERALGRIQQSLHRRRKPAGAAQIGISIGAVLDRHKVGKHFRLSVSERNFTFERDTATIDAEARLDGIYVIRTSVPAADLDALNVVRAYKDLSQVEHAFRSLKTVDLKIRPIYHWLEGRVRAHVFLCMLAYYVEWHMRQRLKPILFDDAEPDQAERPSPVAPAQPSHNAMRKRAGKTTPQGLPAHSFQTLLRDLATCTLNQTTLAVTTPISAHLVARPTPLQTKAFELLGIDPNRTQ